MDTSPSRPSDPTVVSVPVVEERLELDRRTIVTGTVRIERTVETREAFVDEPLRRESVRIERVPVGRVLEDDEHPVPREDGDRLVVPVVEEVLVVHRRRVLKEELHVWRVSETYHAPQRVVLAAERVEVRRHDAGGRPVGDAEGTVDATARPTSLDATPTPTPTATPTHDEERR